MVDNWLFRRHGSRSLAIPQGDVAAAIADLWRDHLQFIPPHYCDHGFRKDRARDTAVAPHRGATYVMHLDLVHFFASCAPWKVRNGLQCRHVSGDVVSQVMRICFVNGGLPLGSCASPRLSSMAAFALDTDLSQCGMTYTRYADNIMLSSNEPPDEGLIRGVIRSHAWRVNEGKSWLRRHGRVRVKLLGLRL